MRITIIEKTGKYDNNKYEATLNQAEDWLLEAIKQGKRVELIEKE